MSTKPTRVPMTITAGTRSPRSAGFTILPDEEETRQPIPVWEIVGEGPDPEPLLWAALLGVPEITSLARICDVAARHAQLDPWWMVNPLAATFAGPSAAEVSPESMETAYKVADGDTDIERSIETYKSERHLREVLAALTRFLSHMESDEPIHENAPHLATTKASPLLFEMSGYSPSGALAGFPQEVHYAAINLALADFTPDRDVPFLDGALACLLSIASLIPAEDRRALREDFNTVLGAFAGHGRWNAQASWGMGGDLPDAWGPSTVAATAHAILRHDAARRILTAWFCEKHIDHSHSERA